jgi:hypothetical protein
VVWLDIFEPSANLVGVVPQGASLGEVGAPEGMKVKTMRAGEAVLAWRLFHPPAK